MKQKVPGCHPGRHPGGADRLGHGHERRGAGHVGSAGRLRPDQRHQGHQRGRRAPRGAPPTRPTARPSPSLPRGITVTFNKPIDFSTVSKKRHRLHRRPRRASPSILGTPSPIDDPKFPTKVALPLQLRLHDPADHHGQRHLHLHRHRGDRLQGRQGAGPVESDHLHPERHDRARGRRHDRLLADRDDPVHARR